MSSFVRFKKDPAFLLKQQIVRLGILIPVSIFLFTRQEFLVGQGLGVWLVLCFLIMIPHLAFNLIGSAGALTYILMGNFEFNWFDSLIILAAVAFGFGSDVLMHLVSHQSLKPKFLNKILGEFLSFHQLVNYHAFSVLHMVCHRPQALAF